MKSLFDSTFTSDDAELDNLLAAARVKDFLDDLWAKYSPFVTEQSKFIAGMKAQPFTRIWEMYLGCALGESGLVLEPKGEEGPDIRLSNPRVWVEAVVSTDGQKLHSNGQPTSKVPEVLLHESMWGGPPEDGIIWRCATSIDAKKKKFNGYLAKGTVKQDEACVVGLNVHKTSFAQYDHQHTQNHIPLIAKVLFGYGRCVALQLHDRKGLSPPISIAGFHYEFTPRLLGQVPTDIFFQEEASTISALIISKEGFWSWHHRIPQLLSEGLMVIHNPLARNPLPRKWLKSGHEIWIDQGQLHKQTWQSGIEHTLESFPLPYDLPPEIRVKL
ncbi:MAG TPA: hypothetical protein VK582_09175 [Pyrinomonadaceae bacterium]|nr:hypothetical protein [Pyrinomonadaceae bacterium]